MLRGLTTVSFFADDITAARSWYAELLVTASVVDPFGNILGIMYNQHYLQVLDSRAGAVT